MRMRETSLRMSSPIQQGLLSTVMSVVAADDLIAIVLASLAAAAERTLCYKFLAQTDDLQKDYRCFSLSRSLAHSPRDVTGIYSTVWRRLRCIR